MMQSLSDHEQLPPVSVVVPALNEERAIEACLRSILAQDYPLDRLEILVFDGGSHDRTRELVEQVAAAAAAPIRLFDNPERSVPAALNKALDVATGEFLIRVDAHSIPAPDYVRGSVEGNLDHDADLAGGWVDAVGETAVGHAVAAAIRSPWATGNPASWHRPQEPIEVDSVPCGSYRLSSLRAIGGFDEAQHANQDFEANYRLRRAGGRVLLLPNVSHRYIVRDSFVRLARQFARYGFYKARTMLKHPSSIRVRHLVPAATLAGMTTLAVVAPFWTPDEILFVVAGVAYLVALTVASVRAGRGFGRPAWLLPLVFFTMHVTWAAGNLAGLVRWLPALRTIRDETAERARTSTA